MTRDDPFDLVGDVLDGQYRVDAVAGEGDLSVVYKGHHLGVDATVAIKCLNLPATLDHALVRPLVDDFREASRLHYRLARGSLHIAQSLGSGQTIAPRTGATVPYLVREWFEGESLAADLARRRSEGREGRSVEEAIALLEPAIEAIAYAQEQGTPHLSINPSNLFIARRSGKSSIVVLDFGVARTMNEIASGLPPDSQSTRGLRLLFPAYAAPEQLDRSVGEAGPWTDVYAIALIFMELVSDRVVMHGIETGALVDRALHEAKRPTPAAHGLHLTRNLELVLTRAVARTPSKRQKDAGTFWRDLKSAHRGSASRAIPKPADAPRLPQSPTLMGIAPAGAASDTSAGGASDAPTAGPSGAPASAPAFAVAGAVPGRARAASAPRVETKPMSFDPEQPSPSTDDQPAPVQMEAAKLPPPPPVESPTPPAWALLPGGARSPAATIALVSGGSLVMFALLAGLVTFVAGSLSKCAVAAPASSAAAASSLPDAVEPPAESGSAPSVASAAPAVPAHFSAAAAKRAFNAASRGVAACKRGARWGTANATVTFDPDGSVKEVLIGAPFKGTATGKCVSDMLGAVRVPAFAGDPVVYVTPFYVAPR
jgi:serine/threonine protein kinase